MQAPLLLDDLNGHKVFILDTDNPGNQVYCCICNGLREHTIVMIHLCCSNGYAWAVTPRFSYIRRAVRTEEAGGRRCSGPHP